MPLFVFNTFRQVQICITSALRLTQERQLQPRWLLEYSLWHLNKSMWFCKIFKQIMSHDCINTQWLASLSIFTTSVLTLPGETCSTLWSGPQSLILWPTTRAGRETEQGSWSTAVSASVSSMPKPWWTSLIQPPGSMCQRRSSVSSGMILFSRGKWRF